MSTSCANKARLGCACTLEEVDDVLLRGRKGQASHADHPRVDGGHGHAVGAKRATRPTPHATMPEPPNPSLPVHAAAHVLRARIYGRGERKKGAV